MPTHDLFHDAVKHGLTKDGWTITDDPLIICLAVPKSAYTAFFRLPLAQIAIQRHSLHLIVYDPATEALVQWIN
jgi:hypothetical protein